MVSLALEEQIKDQQQKITTTTLITKKRHMPGGESFEGSGGQHPDPEAISLPVGRRHYRRRQFRRRHNRWRHYRRRHFRFSPTTPMYRGGVCAAIASGFSASAKSSSSSSSSTSSSSSNNAFFYFAVVNVMYEKLIVS